MKICKYCSAQIADDSCFCAECGKEVAQANVCPHCGASINDGDAFCQSCGKRVDDELSSTVSETTQKKCLNCGVVINDEQGFCEQCGTNLLTGNSPIRPMEQPADVNLSPTPMSIPQSHVTYQESSKNNGILIAVIGLLAAIICGVGGYFYYDNIYLPAKIDREAPRYYTSANVVVLRSSRSAGADFNKVASLPYGTELITYEHDSEWSRVKVNFQNGEKQEGYVASPYILNKADFFLMNSIFGNQESKEAIITNKCRLALLNYFKEKRYVGKIDEQMRIEAGITITPSRENQWQVFTKPKDAKPNNVLFKRLYNKNSQFTDFAVIITNSVTNARKLLYFYFDDDETPHLLTEQDAPEQGYIVNATYEYDYYSGSKELNAYYSY